MVPVKITDSEQLVTSLNIRAAVFHQIENHRKLLNSICHIGAVTHPSILILTKKNHEGSQLLHFVCLRNLIPSFVIMKLLGNYFHLSLNYAYEGYLHSRHHQHVTSLIHTFIWVMINISSFMGAF